MPKFCVRYYKIETNIVRYEMTVEAADEMAARQRVFDGFKGDVELTDEELETEQSGKEFSEGTVFSHMEDPNEPFAVCEVI